MKVVDPKLELKVLRTVCGGDSTLASGLLPTLTTASFHYPPCIEAFRHIMSAVQSSGAIPDWHALTADPTISDKTRRVLKTCELPAVREAVKAQSLVKTLDRYRQLRGVASIAETIYGQIDSDQVDVDELTEHISNELVSIRSRNDTKNQLKHLGKGNNSMSVLNELLNGERRPVVPTGFKGFDDRNGGFLYGSLVVIAANSGGGKSALANQLAVNIASIAREDCCFPAGTLVDTVDGPKPIDKLLVGDEVFSFNKDSGKTEVKPVTGLAEIKTNKRMVRIKHAGGVFECTEDHKVWCLDINDYVEAGKLTTGMLLAINRPQTGDQKPSSDTSA